MATTGMACSCSTPDSRRYLLAHLGEVQDGLLRALLWDALWEEVRETRISPVGLARAGAARAARRARRRYRLRRADPAPDSVPLVPERCTARGSGVPGRNGAARGHAGRTDPQPAHPLLPCLRCGGRQRGWPHRAEAAPRRGTGGAGASVVGERPLPHHPPAVGSVRSRCAAAARSRSAARYRRRRAPLRLCRRRRSAGCADEAALLRCVPAPARLARALDRRGVAGVQCGGAPGSHSRALASGAGGAAGAELAAQDILRQCVVVGLRRRPGGRAGSGAGGAGRRRPRARARPQAQAAGSDRRARAYGGDPACRLDSARLRSRIAEAQRTPDARPDSERDLGAARHSSVAMPAFLSAPRRRKPSRLHAPAVSRPRFLVPLRCSVPGDHDELRPLQDPEAEPARARHPGDRHGWDRQARCRRRDGARRARGDLARRRRRSRGVGRHHPRRRQGLLRRRQPRPGRAHGEGLRHPRARVARGEGSGLQPDQLLQDRGVGHARPGGRARGW